MNARTKLDEFAKLNSMNKNQPIGWSVAADFAEWYAEQSEREIFNELKLCYSFMLKWEQDGLIDYSIMRGASFMQLTLSKILGIDYKPININKEQ